MQQCSNCGHQNRAGVVFCENCGASLIGKLPLDTKSLDSSTEEEKSQIGVDESVITDAKVQGKATFAEGTLLRLDIEGSTEPIQFKPKSETIFGRRDPATGAMPDVDLTPFAGYRMGVSRRHAAIRQAESQTLALWDLGSSNGTYLNGQRLNAHRPYPLRDGDELRLGQMVIRVHFQLPGKEEVEPTDAPTQETEEEVKAQEPASRGSPPDQPPGESIAQPAAPTEAAVEQPAAEPPPAPLDKPVTTEMLSSPEPEAKTADAPETVEPAEPAAKAGPKDAAPAKPPAQDKKPAEDKPAEAAPEQARKDEPVAPPEAAAAQPAKADEPSEQTEAAPTVQTPEAQDETTPSEVASKPSDESDASPAAPPEKPSQAASPASEETKPDNGDAPPDQPGNNKKRA